MNGNLTRRTMLLSGTASAGLAALPAVGVSAVAPDPAIRSRDSRYMNEGWRFYDGDIPMPEVRGHGWTYANAKAGNAWGAAPTNFDDSLWDEVRIPHDFVVTQPFQQDANLSQGYRRRGVAWYRRTLRFDESERGRHLELQLGAAATHATVWFNGTVVDRNFSGYNGINIDLTPFARYGQLTNSLAIRIDANAMEGWWYEGGGLYRHVKLVSRDPVHIATDGLYADPHQNAEGGWTVPVQTTVKNIAERAADIVVEVAISDGEGRVVARGQSRTTVQPLGSQMTEAVLSLGQGALWSVDTPNLYTVEARLVVDGAERDRASVKTGLRTFRFDPDTGFYLNDRPTKIHGVCVHQDHAGVGVAVPDSLWDFRVRRLKAMGCNAIRISHHAPAVELLDACDRLGMLVLNENRVFNPAPDFIGQLEWLVRRDRSRACVFLWSVFNEEPMQGTEQGYEMVRRMVAAVKALDARRAVTAAMNDGVFTPVNVSQAVDVMGFNYQQTRYDAFHAAHPDVPLISTEDTSAFQTRGAWETDLDAHVMAEDDTMAADWGATHRDAWKMIAERPFVAGAFVWTGFDYRGEPSPFDWPSASSFFGAMDLCGFPKGAFHLHRAQWVRTEPVLTLLPHWNWQGREGEPIKVMAFSNAEEVELSLNGRSLGRQVVDPYRMNSWTVPYAPGKLDAVGFVGGARVSVASVETTGESFRLRLTPDRTRLTRDGTDVTPVTVEALDRRGRPVPTANIMVRFSIEGGDIIGLGNGNPNSHEPETGDRRSLFNGLAQVLVRSSAGDARALVLRAQAEGLRPARLSIALDPGAQPPSVPPAAPVMTVEGWRMSPVSPTLPGIDWVASDSDQNSWQWLQPGSTLPAGDSDGFVIYRTTLTPWAAIQRGGGVISLGRVTSAGEVWLDGIKIADTRPGVDLTAPLPPREGERSLVLRLLAVRGRPTGLLDVVTVRPAADNSGDKSGG